MSRKPFSSLENKHYDPVVVEDGIYKLWEAHDVFTAKPHSGKKPYSIVIPPPNVTGRLHMGHALNNTVQDTLIRFKRMDGYDAVWIPGTDHAGISTQSVVKKQLDAQGVNYLELGREKMIERIWEWKEKYGNQILNQLRRMGCSCDWSRCRFTMDEGLSQAVVGAFKRLYDRGLIYRGKYIVNWCPVDRTALSDDEVVTEEGGEPGHLWQFRYPFADGSGSLVIATTRPETVLGDAAVAVNPKDERYQQFVGKMILLPIVGREIPVIADDYADRTFGTGCLKVTPAHDPNDFQIGLRHQLPQFNVMNEDATMGEDAPAEYWGLDRFECRKRIVEEMDRLGLLVSVEERMTPVGRAQRSRAVIEYRLSDQWFVKMKPLAEASLTYLDDGSLKFYPERWEQVFRHWLSNTRDWCISRQIWWGHRIPAWYHKETGEILVDSTVPQRVIENPEQWRQEDDVLDTWFSSALWPYSTLGWPNLSEDLKRYYPTSLLSTAKDIIYFWVARMVMTGVEFMNDTPFSHVYLHPVICDENGETMSKSKGNGIDPLHVIEGATTAELEEPVFEARPSNMDELLKRIRRSYPEGFKGVGADALRFTLLSLNSYSQQVQVSFEKFDDVGRKFTEKLWNATRFVIMGLEEIPPASVGDAPLTYEDRWILGRLDTAVRMFRSSVEVYQFSEATTTLYRFFWDDFCDWYVELTKARLRSDNLADKRRAQSVLGEVLLGLLRLLHPVVPYITEELWGHIQPRIARAALLSAENAALEDCELCALAPFPQDLGRANEEQERNFAFLQQIVAAIRNTRAAAKIPGSAEVAVLLRCSEPKALEKIKVGESIIIRGAKLKSLGFTQDKPERMAVGVVPDVEIFVNLAEHMDVEAEIKRNELALKKVEAEIEKFQSRLNNEAFMAKAPEAVREGERRNLAEAESKRSKVLEALQELAQSK